ncbi:hypothetical protein Brms1b_008514 [Colletotrichum noveboracense]|nr:hypothetical protein Brms1b_008514 [Colletotrichum noveboracense]
MFEDISNSGDGGLYSQQLRNNAFQGKVTTLDPWTVHYGSASISHDADTPLTIAITSSLKITVPPGSGGFTGVVNPGYRGIIIDGGYYNSTFWLRGDFQGDVKIRLLGNETDVEYGWAIIPVDSKADSWTRYEAGFWTTAAPDDLVPENYINAFDFYDDWDRAHPVFIGEYARWGVKWSDMRGACSEAVYMMGWERNADVIKLAAYAPTLQNYDPVNGQWTPNLIPFTNKPDGIVYTPSYHVKKMFATNHGEVVVPVKADVEVNPVWWAASKKADGKVIVKLANYASNSTEVRIQVPGKASSEASFTSITAGPDDANSVENPDVIAPPAVLNISGDDEGVFTVELGQFGVGVLVV